MFKKVVLFAALWALGSSAAFAQGSKLGFLIPNLYGPAGLVVNSEARLPDGSTHSAHFNSAFQAEFAQFNIALASQLASVPLPSPASGFTYELDPGLGVMKRSTQSYGPILSDRAETIGKNKFSVGLNYQRFTYDELEGVDLQALPAVFTHDGASPGGRADVVTTLNAIYVSLDQFTAFFNYGLLDRLDVSLAVPVVRVDMRVISDATVQRVGTGFSPATHFFRDPFGGFGTAKRFEQSGSSTGLGDLIIRLKATAAKGGRTGVALGADVRLPTGDEEDLLGSGAWGVKPFLVFSTGAGRVSPHFNVGYQWNGETVLAGNILTGEKKELPKQLVWAAGADVGLSERVTLAVDVLGRRTIDSPRLQSRTFQALDGKTTFPDIRFVTDSFNVTTGSVGLKLNAGGELLLDLNVLFKLNDAGLRDNVTPLFGLEYSF